MAMRRLSEAISKAIRGGSDDSIPTPTALGANSPKKSSSTASTSLLEGDDTVIVDDTIYEEYDPQRIRELRRSWPQTAEEAAWRYGTTIRSKRSEQEGKLGAKVTALENSLKSDAATADGASQTGSDLFSRQVINWEHLPEDVVVGADRSTVWNGGSGLFDIDINEQEINRIISLFSSGKPSVKKFSIIKTSNTRESVLDHMRATTISVAMKRMRLQQSKFGKLAWALRDMNESYLTPTAVEIMMKSQLWATPKEVEDLRARMREGHELADPDALLWFLATSVPDTATRVSALSFRYEFDEVLGELIRATSLIKSASMEISNSELLKRLMRVILLVGNNINETFGGTAAWGISLSSLSKLTTVKTTDKTLSVLDCIIGYLDQMAPETFEVADECTCVPSAAKYSLVNETKILKDARRGLETVRKIKAMDRFYLSASKKLNDIEREMKHAKEYFDRCLDHFCIPRGSLDTNEFFNALSEFFEDFDMGIAALEARQRQQSNPVIQARSGLMNPAFMKMRRESSMSFSSASGAAKKRAESTGYRPSASRPSIFGRMKPDT